MSMMSNTETIDGLWKEIDEELKDWLDIYLIGGASLMYRGLKRATKDIDIIADSKKSFDQLHNALLRIGFDERNDFCLVFLRGKGHQENRLSFFVN